MIDVLHLQLRDIFRVHPETGCNTHDLLDCGCDAVSKHFNDNVASVSGNDIEVDDDDDDEDAVGIGFVNASQVKPRHIEKMDGAVRISIPFFTIHRITLTMVL